MAIHSFRACICLGLLGMTSGLSFSSQPNQALYSNVDVSAIVSTSSSASVWTINWVFNNVVVATVQIQVSTGNTIRSPASTPYQTRLSVTEFPTTTGVYTSYNTTLTINNVTTSDTFSIRAEADGTTSPNSIALSVKECNDTYQGLTPSNNANYMGTATFKCIGANTVSVNGTCQADATWSISGTCPLVQCNTTAATDLANGIILTNSGLLNTLVNRSNTVSVKCDVGYTGASGTRTCQADTTWSASITCAEVFCNTSAVVSNGICLSSSVTPNSNVAVGSVVSLTCCVGYIPNNGSATCANDGSWNTALVCTPNVTTTGPTTQNHTTQTPTTPSDTTPIFNNNTTATSQPTTTTKTTENPDLPPIPDPPPRCLFCDGRYLVFIVFAILIGIYALVLWTIKFYRIYNTELGYGKKVWMLIGTVTVIPIVVYVIHQYYTKDRRNKRDSPVLVFVKEDWDVWFILCIWLPLIPGILMFRKWHKDVYLIKKQEHQRKIPNKEELQKKLLEQVEPQQKWFMAICIVLGIPMVIYYFVDKSSIKQSNNGGEMKNRGDEDSAKEQNQPPNA